MMSRSKTRLPRNDALIIKLLDEGRIKVDEDESALVQEKGTGKMLPRTEIYIRDVRIKKRIVWLEQAMHPKFHSGHLYFSIYPEGRKAGMIWLSARRVVWYAFLEERKSTGLMICTKDGDLMNYNRWNLVVRDQNEQNYHRVLKEGQPEEEKGLNEEDWPF
jgi:hypothetical protein